MHRFATVLAFTIAAAAPVTAAPVAADPGQDAANARVEVDISERKLYVYNDGSLMNSFDVAVGMPEHPTPTGTFTMDRIIWNPDWVPPDVEWAEDETRKAPGDPENPMQGAKIFFEYPDYYIHGTNARETLGSAASHGCIRMNPVDVENLAEFLQKAGGSDRSDAWFDRIRASDTEKTEVRLEDPITVVIRE
ncbi:MAG: L,D-transpeptidase [Gemmatimonadota bacterium]